MTESGGSVARLPSQRAPFSGVRTHRNLIAEDNLHTGKCRVVVRLDCLSRWQYSRSRPAKDDRQRAMGCMDVGAVSELGAGDPALAELRTRVEPVLFSCLVKRLREGQVQGEIDASMDPKEAAHFVQMTRTGLRLAARGGAGADVLRSLALR